MNQSIKRLYRSCDDTRLAGVCGGLADYLAVDPVVVRLAWVLGTCFTGFAPGIVAYVAAWLVVPQTPGVESVAPVAAQPTNGPA